MTSCIEQLFAVTDLEGFLAEFWPRKATVTHGSLARFESLSSLPELSSVSAVLAAFSEPVMVMMPDERDESSTVKVDGRAARKLYENGMALCFSSVDAAMPEVSRWLQAIRIELGLPSATYARALIYAAKPGAGNKPHYDANANIVVQLQGTKRWQIAPNSHVIDPTDRWAMTSPHLPPELDARSPRMPREMPSDATSIDLVPGSVLFVPRGYWHATDVCSEDTLALNFTYSQPTWAEVVTAALLSRLHREPAFRALADGLESESPDRAQGAALQLDQMFAMFKDHVQNLSTDDVLAELLAHQREPSL